MKMLALVALGLIVCVGAQTTIGGQHCFAPKKFTATLLELYATLAPGSTTPTFNDGYIILDYDYDNKLSRLEMHTLNQTSGNYNVITILNDYPNDNRYIETNGHCYLSKMNGMGVITPPCIPGNFSLMRTYKIGTGQTALTIDVWGGEVRGQRVFFHKQSGTCNPIVQSFYGDAVDGTRELTSYMFADVEQNKLSSANPFVISDLCRNAIPTSGQGSPIKFKFFGAPCSSDK